MEPDTSEPNSIGLGAFLSLDATQIPALLASSKSLNSIDPRSRATHISRPTRLIY